MTQTPPQVYISGIKMANHKLSDRPLLNGLSFGWGTDDLMDFDPPATLSTELLVRQSAVDLGFLKRGANIAVLSTDGTLTFFAGTVTGLTAKVHPSLAGAWIIGITAASKLGDIQGYEIGPFRWGYSRNNAQVLFDNLQRTAPNGWTIDGAARIPEWGSPAVVYDRKPWLWLLDAALRGQRMRRWDTTTYRPGAFTRRITITSERLREGPMGGAPIIRLDAGNIERGIDWVQDPGDLVTDIKFTAHAWLSVWIENPNPTGPGDALMPDYSQNSEGYKFAAEDYVAGIRAMQNQHGYHGIDVDAFIQVAGDRKDTQSEPRPWLPAQVTDLITPYLFTETPWRPKTVRVADTRRLSDASVLALLDVTRRYNAYVIIDGLPANNPTRAARVEAHAIGGSASWDGTKSRWNIELTLGRQTAASGTPKGS